MSQVQKVASRLEGKLVQGQMTGIRPYDMGTRDAPDLNNIVKNIQALVEAFNYLSHEVNQQKQMIESLDQSTVESDNLTEQLEQAGVTITP